MRSGTSCFDRTVFKKTFLRFWPLWAFYSAIWLIVLPLNGLMMLQLDAVNGWAMDSSYSYIKNFADSTVPGMTGPALFLAVVFGVLAAMAVFSHLYNARSANFFGTLPIRREGLFLTHYLSGLAFLVVPNAVIFLLTLLVELAGGHVFLPGLAYWLAVSCGECFFFYSMAVFCAMFTGHILALPAFYGIFNALATVLMGLFTTTLEVFYHGYAGPGQWLEIIARWLTPVWALADEVRGGYFHYDYVDSGVGQEVYVLDGLGAVGIYAAVGLALAVGAFFLYRVRRLESAGDVVSIKCMRPVFRYGVALMAGLCFGFVTWFFLGGGEITLMVSIVAWGVIGCFAAQMLLDRSFRVFHKWKGAAAMAAAFIVLFLAVQFDFTGFESRIPNEADVVSMEVSGLSWDWYSDSGDRIDLDLDDPASMRLMMDLHRAAIGQRPVSGRLGPSTPGSRTTPFNVTYHLANGSTLSRSYHVGIDPSQADQEGTAAWALERIYADRDLYWRVYGFDALETYLSNGWRLENAGYHYYRYDEEYITEDPNVYYYGADAQVLLDAVEEDFRAGRIGVRSVTGGEDYAPDGYERSVNFEARLGTNHRHTVNIFVPDTASSTLAALEAVAGREGGGSTVSAG